MKLQVHAPWEVNDYTHTIIKEKIHKLQTFYKRIERADIYLKKGDGDSSLKDKSVEIRLAVPGPDLFAKENAETLEKAIAAVTDKLAKQLKKHKAKLSGR